MVIDGHAHGCGVYSNVESIISYLDKNNIDKVILCAGEPNSEKNYSYPMLSEIFKSNKLSYFFNKIICVVTKINGVAKHIDEQNRHIYTISKDNKDRIINTYWVNPLEKDCIKKIQKYYPIYNFKIIKMHQCWNKFDMLDSKVIELIKWAKEKQIPIFIHLRSRKQVIKFIRISNQFEDNIFIVAHMIGFEEINKNTNNQNIYFDLSAPQLYSLEIMKKAIYLMGSEKIILGSDTPYGIDNIKINIERLNKLNLKDYEFKNIIGNNIAKILNI